MRLRLIFVLVAGGAIGAIASVASSKGVKFALVAVAVCLGICAGFMIRHTRYPKA